MTMTSSTTSRQSDQGGADGRLPVLTRADKDDQPSFRITRRDVEILKALETARYLTSRQIETLFFRPPGSPPAGKGRVNSRCLRRLQLMFHAGLIDRDEMPQRVSEGRAPLVYWLDEGGAELLELASSPASSGPGDSFIRHRLAAGDVYVAIRSGAAAADYNLKCWIGEDELKGAHSRDREYVTLVGPKGGTVRHAFIPDGYFRLGLGGTTASFFLEVDRATTTLLASKGNHRDMRRKYQAYVSYIDSGRYTQKYGGRGVRVLTVVEAGAERLKNLKRVCEQAGGKRRFWFALAADVTPDRVLHAPVWQVATESDSRRLIRQP